MKIERLGHVVYTLFHQYIATWIYAMPDIGVLSLPSYFGTSKSKSYN